jgi:hypothetical protein
VTNDLLNFMNYDYMDAGIKRESSQCPLAAGIRSIIRQTEDMDIDMSFVRHDAMDFSRPFDHAIYLCDLFNSGALPSASHRGHNAGLFQSAARKTSLPPFLSCGLSPMISSRCAPLSLTQ